MIKRQISLFLMSVIVLIQIIGFTVLANSKGASVDLPKVEETSTYSLVSNPIISDEPVIAITPTTESEPLEYLGEFTTTGYCPCEKCCGKWSNPNNPTTASGKPAIEGVTVGADWNTLPAGTKILIDGIGERVVQDKPAKWIIKRYDGKILDVFYNTHKSAQNHSKQTVKVWIVK